MRIPPPPYRNPVQRLHRLDHPRRYELARDYGARSEPGEALTPNDRRILIHTLWSRGWTDHHIAEWTGWTTYTVHRLRTELELPAHEQQEVA